jgi:hypothetical protein
MQKFSILKGKNSPSLVKSGFYMQRKHNLQWPVSTYENLVQERENDSGQCTQMGDKMTGTAQAASR